MGDKITMQHSYSLKDSNPYKGLSYYRLSQTDDDRKSEVFEPVWVKHSLKQVEKLLLRLAQI